MEARDEGINGVPFFSIRLKGQAEQAAAFSGVQPPDTFKSIFQRLLSQVKSSV